jgi:energy-coupling factor transport system ATP-binding protein
MKEGVVFSLRDLSFSYPGGISPVLDNITLEVNEGEWLALVGSNGSGKSTLARLLNALLVPLQGDCFIYGMDSKKSENLWNIRKSVAMVFQNPDNQIVGSVVEDDTAFGPENIGVDPFEIRERVQWALEVTGLSGMARRATYALSGGQKQRLAIAGALAMYPPAIVLDEPTAMLDPQGRSEIIEVLKGLKKRGITIVYITHRLEEIVYCDRVALLDSGKIPYISSPVDLFAEMDKMDRWGLELPPFVRLWSILREKNVLKTSTRPVINEVLSDLCQ